MNILSKIFINTAYAQEDGLVSCNINCNVCDLIQTGDNILRFLVEISFILVVAAIVWGALIIMTSGGNKNQFEKGKKTLLTALTGLLIVLVAWVFIHTILRVLAGDNLYQGSFQNWVWSEIPCHIDPANFEKTNSNYEAPSFQGFSGGGNSSGGASGSF